jgi:hypothetical protein
MTSNLIENRADYGAYDYCCKKPEIFGSNVEFNLKRETFEQQEQRFFKYGGKNMQSLLKNYNERSNIPLELIRDLLEQCLSKFEQNNFSSCLFDL